VSKKPKRPRSKASRGKASGKRPGTYRFGGLKSLAGLLGSLLPSGLGDPGRSDAPRIDDRLDLHFT
jgi:hypothetical protein